MLYQSPLREKTKNSDLGDQRLVFLNHKKPISATVMAASAAAWLMPCSVVYAAVKTVKPLTSEKKTTIAPMAMVLLLKFLCLKLCLAFFDLMLRFRTYCSGISTTSQRDLI
jgi:hypothetical protein